MLKLFQAEDCPYCQTVRTRRTELGASYVVHNPRTASKEDTRNEHIRSEPVRVGGEDQLPSLVDNVRGGTLYESGDVVAYLDEHYVEGDS